MVHYDVLNWGEACHVVDIDVGYMQLICVYHAIFGSAPVVGTFNLDN